MMWIVLPGGKVEVTSTLISQHLDHLKVVKVVHLDNLALRYLKAIATLGNHLS